jgi:HEAT repeats
MNCDEARDFMATAWKEDTGDTSIAPVFQRHLETCAECSAEMAALGGLWNRLADLPVPEPGLALHARWHATLATLLPERRSGMFWQLAFALACLVIGVLVGVNLPRRGNEEAAEVAKLREMVALSLLSQQSAAERLRGVDYTGSMQTMQPVVVSALIQAVAHDANVNVRLAAVDALSKVATHPGVVESLTRSLPQQDSPMVQAEVIDYLINAHDRRAIGALQQLAERPNLNPAVLERTHYALQQLSH